MCSCSGDCGMFFYQICGIPDAQPSNGYTKRWVDGLVLWEDDNGVIFL